MELYKRCDEVLHYVWDPIGVAGFPGARDEYKMYLPQVFSLIKDGASAAQIVTVLVSIERSRMGMSGNVERARKTADVILRWWKWIRARAAEQRTDQQQRRIS